MGQAEGEPSVSEEILDRAFRLLADIERAEEELRSTAELAQRRGGRLRELRVRLRELPRVAAGSSRAELATLAEDLAWTLEAQLTASVRSWGGVRWSAHQLRNAAGELRRELQGRPRAKVTAPEGASAELELPAEGVAREICWLEAGGRRFALPSSRVTRVCLPHGRAPAPSLTELLKLSPAGELTAHVALSSEGRSAELGVERFGEMEPRLVYPVPEVVRRAGPFFGAVREADGSLGLVLDARDLIARLDASKEALGDAQGPAR